MRHPLREESREMLAEFAAQAAENGTDAVSILSYALTLLAGVLTGAIGGAVVTTSHERAERFRERMITAATDFLTRSFEVVRALMTIRGRIADEWAKVADAEEVQLPPEQFRFALFKKFGSDWLYEVADAEWPLSDNEAYKASRYLRIVYPAKSGVADAADTVLKTCEDERKVYTSLPADWDEFRAALEEIVQRRAQALDDFTAKSQRAIRGRRP